MEWLEKFISLFLHLDQHISELIKLFGHYTYLILFLVIFCETGLVVTPFLPGDSLLFVVGAFSGAGHFNPFLMGGILIAAAIIGDSVNYSLGVKLGPSIFKHGSRVLKPEHLEQTQKFYQKHGNATIILARFVPIIRTFAPFVAGVGHMKYVNFMMYNIVGAIIWVTSLLSLGYFFGHLPWVKKNLTAVILGIVFLSILPPLIEYAKHKWGRRSSTLLS